MRNPELNNRLPGTLGRWAVVFALLFQALAAAYVYGKLYEQVQAQGYRLGRVEEKIDRFIERNGR